MEPKDYGSGEQSMTRAELDALVAMEKQRTPEPIWQNTLDTRTKQHIDYARHYARHYAHGAPGHLDLLTIAKLADLLDEFETNGALQVVKKP